MKLLRIILFLPIIVKSQDSTLLDFEKRKSFFKVTLQPSISYTMRFNDNQGDFKPLKNTLAPTFQGGVSYWKKISNFSGVNIGFLFGVLSTSITLKDDKQKKLANDYLWLGNYLQIPISFRKYVPLKTKKDFWFWEIGVNYQRHSKKLVEYTYQILEDFNPGSSVIYDFRSKIDFAYNSGTNLSKNHYWGVFGGVGRSFLNKNGIFLEGAFLINYTFGQLGTGKYQVQTNEGKLASGKLAIYNHNFTVQLTYGF